jgi:hypothetical protein
MKRPALGKPRLELELEPVTDKALPVRLDPVPTKQTARLLQGVAVYSCFELH